MINQIGRIAVSFLLLFSMIFAQGLLIRQTHAEEPEEPADRITVLSEADTWVNGGSNSGVNYGSSEKMKVKRTSSQNRDAFVKFTVPDISQIQSVTFSVYVVSMESATIGYGGIYDIEVRAMEDTDWIETDLTYDNTPADTNDLALGQITVTQEDIGHYLSLDVTDYVKQHPGETISFRIRGVDQSRGADYATREHEDGVAPKLDIVIGDGEQPHELEEPEEPEEPNLYIEQRVLEDTYTRSGQGPFGDATRMNVKSNSSLSDVRRAFVKFTIPDVEGMLERAEVKLYVDALEGKTPADGYDVTLYGIEHDAWDEMILTDENRPDEAGTPLDQVRVNADTIGTYITFDVTSFVSSQQDGVASFVLQSTSGVSRGAYYRTKEHEGNTPPLLALSYLDYAVPQIPEQVTGTVESKQVTLTWQEAEYAEMYEIERSKDASGVFEKIAEVSTTSYVDTNLENDVPYFYRIRGINQSYVGEYSEVVTVTPRYPFMLTPVFMDLDGNTVERLGDTRYVHAYLEMENLTEQAYSYAVRVQLQHHSSDAMEPETVQFSEVFKTIDGKETEVVEIGFSVPENSQNYALYIAIIDTSTEEQEELYHLRTYLADE